MKQVDTLGVKVDDVSLSEAVEVVGNWLKNGGKHYIVTPNPEFVVAAQTDAGFRNVLNRADLAIPDGVGLKLASDIKNTTSGVDLMERLCREASDLGFTTGFLGGQDGVAKKAAECLKKKYPGLKVAFAESGGKVNDDGQWKIEDSPPVGGLKIDNREIDNPPTIKMPSCGLLFVAFGQVKQEKWIAKNLPKLPVKVAMGVGGSFDELSGRVPRIPSWIHRMRLKWLVRLILQPWRVKRQLALVKFVWLVVARRFSDMVQ